jgi:inhibitor of nuclear factor kappa-B kinase subunit alpha
MKELRLAIFRLFKGGMKKRAIARLLKVPESTVRDDIKRFQETNSHEDRKGRGRKRTVNIASNRQKIKNRLKKNPRLSTRKLAKTIKISRQSVRRIIKNELHMKSYKLKKAQLLTEKAKNIRLERAKLLKTRFSANKHRSILFSDEKLFTIEQNHNRQNDRIWSQEEPSIQDRVVARSQNPKSVMVWAGITYDGKTPLIFIENGVKINQKTYRTMLNDQLMPWAQSHFGDRHWTFQQDSAPAHKAYDTQTWLESNFPDFINVQQWPPYSPDINPMDYSIWSILESNACSKSHTSIDDLKSSLVKAWNEISLDTIAKVVDNFPKRLQLCINSKGGHFEKN